MNNCSNDKIKGGYSLVKMREKTVASEQSSPAKFDLYADFFKAFADPTRLRVLYLLSKEKLLDVGSIASGLGMTDSAISHQLKILKQARLVASERNGKFICYRLDDEHIEDMLEKAAQHVSENN